MRNKKVDIKILELAQTINDAIEYLEERIKDAKIDNNLYLFLDIIEAFSTIELRISKDKNDEFIKVESENLKKSLSIITEYYEKQKYNEIRSFFQFVFIPAFKAWNDKINEIYISDVM